MSVENKIDAARSKYPNIMSLINTKLFEEGVHYFASQKEIIVPKKDKKEVLKIIYSLPIDAETLFILVDVIGAKDKVDIRRKNCI